MEKFFLLPKLLIALGLSVVLAVLSVFAFDYDIFVSVAAETNNRATIPTIEDWKIGLEGLMAEEFFSRDWVNGLERALNETGTRNEQQTVKLNYPRSYPIHEFLFELIAMSRQNACRILESYESIKPKGFGLGISTFDGRFIKLSFREDSDLEWSSGRIAVIIDDFGYRLDPIVERFLKLPFSVTLAIIPGTEYATEVARLAKQAGHEVMIHMPMEPMKGEVENDGYTIFSGMSLEEIEKIVDRALESVPGATGINNHMGSKVTLDSEVMSLLMECLKKRSLFFVDSITNRKSVAFKTAREHGLPTLKLTTFLDNTQNDATMEEIMHKTYETLSTENSAVLIGHDRDETSQALPTQMAHLAQKGVSFVRVSDLLENH